MRQLTDGKAELRETWRDTQAATTSYQAYLLRVDAGFRLSKRTPEPAYAYDLTPAQLIKLYEQQEGKCAVTGVPMTLAINELTSIALHQLDQSMGFYLDNVQLVCRAVSLIRSQRPHAELVEFFRKVVEHRVPPRTRMQFDLTMSVPPEMTSHGAALVCLAEELRNRDTLRWYPIKVTLGCYTNEFAGRPRLHIALTNGNPEGRSPVTVLVSGNLLDIGRLPAQFELEDPGCFTAAAGALERYILSNWFNEQPSDES